MSIFSVLAWRLGHKIQAYSPWKRYTPLRSLYNRIVFCIACYSNTLFYYCTQRSHPALMKSEHASRISTQCSHPAPTRQEHLSPVSVHLKRPSSTPYPITTQVHNNRFLPSRHLPLIRRTIQNASASNVPSAWITLSRTSGCGKAYIQCGCGMLCWKRVGWSGSGRIRRVDAVGGGKVCRSVGCTMELKS